MSARETMTVASRSPGSQEDLGSSAEAGWMLGVPADVRSRIRSGMRWAVWLSVLAVPFSYGGRVFLARTGLETIGAYGLLSVYIGVVTCLLYFGGDSVAIKFLPELDRSKRVSFLFSYFLVVCALIVPWLALATLFPQGLRYLFGHDVSKDFLLLVLALSPLPILFSLIQAVLKANLDLRRAQLLVRTITVGSFLIYAFLFFFERRWFSEHSAGAIWAVYLGLTTLGIALGMHWLRKTTFLRDPQQSLRLRFWLPRGFWAYAFGMQSISFIGLLHGMDFILVLDFGGVKTLGEYVAITTLAFTVPLVCGYFYQTLLPSLTNLLAVDNRQGASEVFRAHMRLLLLVVAVGTCGLIFLASPLLAIFGPAYRAFVLPVLTLSALVGLTTPGSAAGTLLPAIGRPQRQTWVSVLQAGLNVALFFALWPRFHLFGAVLALGISRLIGGVLVFLVATMSVPFRTGVFRDYVRLFVVIIAASAAAWLWSPRSWATGLLGCSLSVLLFLLVGRYRWSECREIWQWVVPNPRSMWRNGWRIFAGSGTV